jgi:hypothetical protein
MRLRWAFLILVLILAGLGVGLILQAVAANGAAVSGTVLVASGPVTGASVRVRATDNAASTDANGDFTISGLTAGEEVEVAAWFDGYYITSTHVIPPASEIVLKLRPYHQKDHPSYDWTSPLSGTGACATCHPMIISQWENNAHGSSVSNPRFFSLYNGTDLTGTVQIEPGFVNDFPGTAGLCASCHAPGLGVDGYLTTDMNTARDVVTAGIHCDYCHKLGGVYLNPATMSVYPNAPGVESTRVLRPPLGENIFFGPYDDIKDPDTYLPEISESQFCAPCHQFSFWGTPIYESYNEWLASPYATEGTTCQDCHMPPNGDEYFALPEKGGLLHPPETIPSHLQLGATSLELLQNTVQLAVTAQEYSNSQIDVTVVITNTGAGHHVPTDFPGRHMLLQLTATDGIGQPLGQIEGPTIPSWGGEQAGMPGMVFAKVLRDVVTGDFPVVSYWKHTLIETDNRIPAMGVDQSTYRFDMTNGEGPVEVRVQLFFRRVSAGIAQQKGWDVADILMEDVSITLP